ncbi:hypothetical protein SAMD00019534_118070, partial [Acytostelium subglobosum LB1]|uniref:hypothetical protein n=1 Tax=Acytostelium subglobosum LB1 TaxID=1410327 RepID=UPI000644C4ED
MLRTGFINQSIRSLSLNGRIGNISSINSSNILYRNGSIRQYSSTETTEENDSNKSTTTQTYKTITPEYRINMDDLDIANTIKSTKTKIIAMPFEYSYTSFYKGKRSTRKGFTKKKAHLKEFGVVPYVFPESMFRQVIAPIPLDEVNKNSTVTKQQQEQQQQQQ